MSVDSSKLSSVFQIQVYIPVGKTCFCESKNIQFVLIMTTARMFLQLFGPDSPQSFSRVL